MVTEILEKIKTHFGGLMITIGKKNPLLGMDITLTNYGKVKIGIKHQFQEAIDAFGENIEGSVTSPTSGYLYTLNGDVEKLDTKKKEVFHSATAKLM